MTYDISKAKYVITHDGIFDYFNDSGITDNHLTNNSNNVGSSFTQAGGELVIADHASLQTLGVKYQNRSTLVENQSKPWVVHYDVTLEVNIKLDAYADMAGFSITHSDEDFTSADFKFWVGLYRDAVDNGLKIIDPGASTTKYNTPTVSAATFYKLRVRIYYDYYANTDNTKIKIFAWLDEVLIINGFTQDRTDLWGQRLDGKIGLAVDIPTTAGGGGDVHFDYFVCNRIPYVFECKYKKTSLFTIGDIKLVIANVRGDAQAQMSEDTLIQVYARNLSSDDYVRRWHGHITNIGYPKGMEFAQSLIEGSHFSKLLDGRKAETTYTAKDIEFIISDATFGLLPLYASDLLNTSSPYQFIDEGDVSLTKDYKLEGVRSAILELASDVDYFPYWDDNDYIHVEKAGLIDNGKSYTTADSKMLSHNFKTFAAELYSECLVYGETHKSIVRNPAHSYREDGGKQFVITDPKAKTLAECELLGINFFSTNATVVLGTVVIFLDNTLNIGEVITITSEYEAIGIADKKFVITEMLENQITRTQHLTVVENLTTLIDLMFIKFLETQKLNYRRMNQSAADSDLVYLRIPLELSATVLVEVDTGGGYVEHYSGKAQVLNRAKAIVPAVIGNGTTNPSPVDLLASGLIMQIGTGSTTPRMTDTALESVIGGGDKTITTSPTRTDTTKTTVKTAAIWAVGDVNGNTLKEVGFYIDFITTDTFQNSQYAYGTTSQFAPYNIGTQLSVRAVFDDLVKDNTKAVRITIELYAETVNHQSKRSI